MIILWSLVIIPVFLQLLSYIYLFYKYVIYGSGLGLEQTRLDSTIRAMTSRSAMLKHSIKNQVVKTCLCATNIKNAIDRPICDKQEIRNNLQNVFDSMEHLTYIMARLEEQTEKIVLLESSVDLLGLIKKAIEMQKIYLDQKIIKVVENYIDSSLYVYCDQVHMLEVIDNIIKNAGEAITSDNGIIELGLYAYKKNLVIEIKDNGVGITKENIQYVFDPFFSTKKLSKNFGLGLTYAYTVMQKHDGHIEIKSAENCGTTILLVFPQSRVLSPFSFKFCEIW